MSEEKRPSDCERLKTAIRAAHDMLNELHDEVAREVQGNLLDALAFKPSPTSRWDAFSDEELEALYRPLGEKHWDGAVAELERQMHASLVRRREAERLEGPSYRGPGIYRYQPGGWTFEVMGILEEAGLVVTREKSGLRSIDCRYFEETCTAHDGKTYRRFEYVRPLPRPEETS